MGDLNNQGTNCTAGSTMFTLNPSNCLCIQYFIQDIFSVRHFTLSPFFPVCPARPWFPTSPCGREKNKLVMIHAVLTLWMPYCKPLAHMFFLAIPVSRSNFFGTIEEVISRPLQFISICTYSVSFLSWKSWQAIKSTVTLCDIK